MGEINSKRKMNLGVILPHTKLYGGVKRFLELGNIFIERGHSFTVYTIEGKAPVWFDFKGETKSFATLKEDDLDAVFTTETKFLEELTTANAKRKIIYHVRMKEKMEPFLKFPDVEVYACSSNIWQHDKKKYHIDAFKAVGGVNTANYQIKDSYVISESNPFVVMAYGRLAEKVKGTKYVVKACEKLYRKGYNVKLLLFDTAISDKAQMLIDDFSAKVPFDFIQNHPFDKNSELFNRADLFVAAEGHAGWANTVAEAMACGLPVIATKAGTKDLLIDNETGLLSWRNSISIRRKIKRLMQDEELRKKLGRNARKNVENFDWHRLAERIEEHLMEQINV